uniref:Uncharacterized protein n=1 Tax=Pipistrellus kuhlii TaxID=59472 RepID=A0A7J7YWQ8_PIPKU|nr:hypothetical protein mPipKuh1_009881 [Pipistrellus kuhlii]
MDTFKNIFILINFLGVWKRVQTSILTSKMDHRESVTVYFIPFIVTDQLFYYLTRGLEHEIHAWGVEGGASLRLACPLWLSGTAQGMSDCQFRPDPTGIGIGPKAAVRHPSREPGWLVPNHWPACLPNVP